MLATGKQIIEAAKAVGMKVPPALWDKNISELRELYPHFFIFYTAQFGKPMTHWHEHEENARVIIKIEESRLMSMTLSDLIAEGFKGG